MAYVPTVLPATRLNAPLKLSLPTNAGLNSYVRAGSTLP